MQGDIDKLTKIQKAATRLVTKNHQCKSSLTTISYLRFILKVYVLCKHTIWLWYVSVILLYCCLNYAHAYFF